MFEFGKWLQGEQKDLLLAEMPLLERIAVNGDYHAAFHHPKAPFPIARCLTSFRRTVMGISLAGCWQPFICRESRSRDLSRVGKASEVWIVWNGMRVLHVRSGYKKRFQDRRKHAEAHFDTA